MNNEVDAIIELNIDELNAIREGIEVDKTFFHIGKIIVRLKE